MTDLFTHAVVLDFEATCDDVGPPRPQEVIEFPSLLLSLATFEVVDSFEAFVRPHHHPRLTDFCRRFTAIAQSDVDGAEGFAAVLDRHRGWLGGHGLGAADALIVTCGDWDLGSMLPAQCPVAVPPVEALPEIYTRWQNLKRPFCQVTGRSKAPGMAGMLQELGLPLLGHHHRGIDDCRNLAALYRELLWRGARPEVTARLPPEKYPPIKLRLRLGDRIEDAVLPRRDMESLRRLAGRTFKCRVTAIQREDGRALEDEGDLLSLSPGEALRLS